MAFIVWSPDVSAVDPETLAVNHVIPGVGEFTFKPGRTEVKDLELAKIIVKDLNKSCVGEKNNPFRLELK